MPSVRCWVDSIDAFPGISDGPSPQKGSRQRRERHLAGVGILGSERPPTKNRTNNGDARVGAWLENTQARMENGCTERRRYLYVPIEGSNDVMKLIPPRGTHHAIDISEVPTCKLSSSQSNNSTIPNIRRLCIPNKTSPHTSQVTMATTAASPSNNNPDIAADLPLPLPAATPRPLPGVTSIPRLIYGTAWKTDRTAHLVTDALSAGFRAIDTAAQPKHYREDLVGAGLRAYLSSPTGPVARSALYVQTKFTPSQTPSSDQPIPVPYDPDAPIDAQIRASVSSSLAHLSHLPTPDPPDQDAPYIDALLLHSPLPSPSQTLAAWRAMEQLVPHPVRRLGISNIYYPEDLAHLIAHATIKPSVVQNRFYPATGHDRDIRALCRRHGIVYQSFWTLTANPRLLRSRPVSRVAAAAAVSAEVALYALVLALGPNCVLNGTTRREHMREDLDGLRSVAAWSATGEGDAQWREDLAAFRVLISDYAADDSTAL
ncbi:hypothetical protein ACRALDRAFT_2022047 [Sodiomyces alcalophilus JCM 7366]|uniref:uncharacterized protein n=1 Tax=Sodiomyces alcalophilus JCM 7366 TaxID=591952 RepID=UPI0039B68752